MQPFVLSIIKGVRMTNKISSCKSFLKKVNLLRTRELGIFIAIVLLLIIFSILQPKFATITNLLNLGRQISTIGIMSIGMTFLIIGRNFDLSIGSMFALVSTIVAIAMVNGIPVFIALLIGIIFGSIFGFINGVLSTFAKIPSFVVGLGMLNAYRGAQLIITGGRSIVVLGLGGIGANFFYHLGGGRLFGYIPMMFITFIVLWAIGHILLTRTTFGLRTFAVGGSPMASKIAGINENWVQTYGFVLQGIVVAVAIDKWTAK